MTSSAVAVVHGLARVQCDFLSALGRLSCAACEPWLSVTQHWATYSRTGVINDTICDVGAIHVGADFVLSVESGDTVASRKDAISIS